MNPLDLRSIAAVLVFVCLASGPVCVASPDGSASSALVRVRLYDNFRVPVDEIAGALNEAAVILREAGIEPEWLLCSRETRGLSSSARCGMEVEPDEVVVRIIHSPRLNSANGDVPLGEALLDIETHTGSLATIFPDRVARISERAGANRSGVLGRVIAHEIGHLLLGTHSHATRGLMRAIWTDEELRRPVGLEWHFSAAEARRIQSGIIARGMSTPTS